MSDLPPIKSGCWNCGRRGHGFRDCPEWSTGYRCNLCGFRSHTKFTYPRPLCRRTIGKDEERFQRELEEAKQRERDRRGAEHRAQNRTPAEPCPSPPRSAVAYREGIAQRLAAAPPPRLNPTASLEPPAPEAQPLFPDAQPPTPLDQPPVQGVGLPVTYSEVKQQLRSVLEAFWVSHMCAVAPQPSRRDHRATDPDRVRHSPRPRGGGRADRPGRPERHAASEPDGRWNATVGGAVRSPGRGKNLNDESIF